MEPPGTVLIVDDREPNRQVLAGMLETAGHRVLEASSGARALELAVDERPDAVVLDVSMPEMDGFEVCRRMKQMAETSMIPIVFLTANLVEETDQVRGLELGAYDYLVKPVTLSLLLARIGVMLRIRRAEEKIRQLSMVDEFTGLFSRKYVLHRLDEEIERAARRGSGLAVAMIDLDDFKTCNDRFGHQFGDRVLRRVSAVFKASIRLYDSLGRYGGEEFLLVQPEATGDDALATLRRLQEKIGAERFERMEANIRLSFSAGFELWTLGLDAEELIRRADCALYAAKRSGKRQTVRYAEVHSAPPPESSGG